MRGVTTPRLAASQVPRQFPASLFEQGVGWLDGHAEPWTVGLAVGLAGPVEVEALRLAVADAVARHPLLRARETDQAPAEDARWRPWWSVQPPGPVPFEQALAPGPGEGDARVDEFVSRPFDLREEGPVRALWAAGIGGGKLVLSVAHQACDGVGAARLAEHVLAAYGRRLAGRAPDRAEEPVGRFLREPVTLGRRVLPAALRPAGGLAGPGGPPGDVDPHGPAGAALAAAGRLARPVVRVQPDGGWPEAPGHVTASASFPLGELPALAVAREVAGATVNDVLVAALHRAVGAWQAGHGAGGGGRVSVLVPVNLRPPGARDAGAANVLGAMQVVTSPGERATLAVAVAAVASRTGARKRSGLVLAPHAGLLPATLLTRRGAARLLPLGRAVLARTLDTGMVSNLGRLSWPLDLVHPGGATVAGATFYPPTWRTMRVALGALTLWDRLHLGLRVPRARFSPEAAEALLGLVAAELSAPAEPSRASR